MFSPWKQTVLQFRENEKTKQKKTQVKPSDDLRYRLPACRRLGHLTDKWEERNRFPWRLSCVAVLPSRRTAESVLWHHGRRSISNSFYNSLCNSYNFLLSSSNEANDVIWCSWPFHGSLEYLFYKCLSINLQFANLLRIGTQLEICKIKVTRGYSYIN